FEAVIGERPRQIEHLLMRLNLLVGFRANKRRHGEEGDPGKDQTAHSHFASPLLWISSINFVTASFSFFTSSRLGPLPGWNATSFSTAVSCSFTLLTSGSLRKSMLMSLILVWVYPITVVC